MPITREQNLPSREIHSKKWSRKVLSSFSVQLHEVTKKWSIFVWMAIVSLTATFILELTNDVGRMWYVMVCILIITSALLESPLGKKVEYLEEKKRNEKEK